METRANINNGKMSVLRLSKLPFEQLPNLPKAVIPKLELQVEPIDWTADTKAISEQRNVGRYSKDESCQTDETELGDVKEVSNVLEELTLSVSNLRKDLSFAQSVLKAEYESSLVRKATELHHAAGARVADLEKDHKEKIEKVRTSYHVLLNNAIKRICGEYKAYYEDILSGKTGRHDLIIKNLKERVIELETESEEKEETITVLETKVKALETELGVARTETVEEVFRMPTPSPPPPPGISEEEVEKLNNTIDELSAEIKRNRLHLGQAETANSKLSQQVKELTKDLEDEKRKVQQLRKDLEMAKTKAREQQEKTAKLAKGEMEAMQKEMSEKMDKMQNEVMKKSQRDAELAKAKEEAKLQQELAKQKALEDQLARERENMEGLTNKADKASLENEIAKLRKIEAFQKKEISRLQSEVDNAGKSWEIKLAIMQKNFHAFKDEAFIRKSLQRQAAQLHQATVAYTVDGAVTGNQTGAQTSQSVGQHSDYYQFSPHKPLPELAEEHHHNNQPPQAPSPSPRHLWSDSRKGGISRH